MVIKVLRPSQASALISARAFEDQFARNLQPDIHVDTVSLKPWLEEILGNGPTSASSPGAATRFAVVTDGYAFLCPDHSAIPLCPLFMALRNRAASPIRLLLIAHAPGAYGLEWALLRPLLSVGDVIIAPSESARSVIHLLCPQLAPYVRVIPHPIAPLPRISAPRPPRILSLSRIHRTKLIHRQIEAFAVLARRNPSVPNLAIAGPLQEPGSADIAPYARSLIAKIARLGLQDRVTLAGPIDAPVDKSAFLQGANFLLNLSATIEESYGKAAVEALGSGVPVLATQWNGLPEVIGEEGGRYVPLHEHVFGVDLAVDVLADAMAEMLESPPTREACVARAERVHPDRIRPRYSATLSEALDLASRLPKAGPESLPDTAAAPDAGLLSHVTPLTQFTWQEVFAFHTDAADRLRNRTAPVSGDVAEAEQLRSLILQSVRAPLERHLAGLPMECGPGSGKGESNVVQQGPAGFLNRIGAASVSRGLLTSRLACLDLLANAKETSLLVDGLEAMAANGTSGPGVDFLRIEAARQRGDLASAFRMSIAPTDEARWGEFAAPQVSQLASVCREWGVPGLALPWLRDWLDAYPDAPDSGRVWADRYLNASQLGDGFEIEAQHALESARALLGTSFIVTGFENEAAVGNVANPAHA